MTAASVIVLNANEVTGALLRESATREMGEGERGPFRLEFHAWGERENENARLPL